ncbi:hypothetical protein [Adlercreutzia faecimuris]|uniref:Head-tail adaptor protein n=1 Tax=Adlercreutzia faecimuris TaxID=2897341 RepID=A0ABS9WF70_9ACTN|nr:hypothetical protein [Adlercreutzia sp. JBNU-10]MCI2241514.1 hypothetical protein [Adlercreutzia sp. JBNU-10]
MLKPRKHLPAYNDGILRVYREERGRVTDFGAPRNVYGIADMELVARLAYRVEGCREQDFEFAERASFQLTLKVSTQRVGGIDAGCKVVIGRTLFDIGHVDPSRTELYFYLQEVGEVDDA